MADLSIVVMAAGLGSRYGGLKQVEPVGPNDEILLDYALYDAIQAGFSKIVFVVNEDLQDSFRERVFRTSGQHCETRFVVQSLSPLPGGYEIPPERRKPWGTAHAVLSCKDVVSNPFAVINADDFYGRTALQELASWLTITSIEGWRRFCMVGYRLANTLTEHGHVARGVCKVDENHHLVAIEELTRIEKVDGVIKHQLEDGSWREIPGDPVVSMNLWGFTPSIFPYLQAGFLNFLERNQVDLSHVEFFIPDVVNRLVKENTTVEVLPSQEHWFGVTYPKDRDRVRGAIRNLIERGVYPESLWNRAA